METQTIKAALTWEYAVEIYTAVLANPDASFDALREAKEELKRMARILDQQTSR